MGYAGREYSSHNAQENSLNCIKIKKELLRKIMAKAILNSKNTVCLLTDVYYDLIKSNEILREDIIKLEEKLAKSEKAKQS